MKKKKYVSLMGNTNTVHAEVMNEFKDTPGFLKAAVRWYLHILEFWCFRSHYSTSNTRLCSAFGQLLVVLVFGAGV